MHSFWTGLLGILDFLWIITAVRMLWGMAIVPRLTAITPLRDAECPTVSILVAARDEAAGLARSLPTLLAQDYPHYEVIVVDDRSSDSTPRILEEFASLHKNLRVIHLTELPPGWLGKSHALATAHAHATGDWLIFTDPMFALLPTWCIAPWLQPREKAGIISLCSSLQTWRGSGRRLCLAFGFFLLFCGWSPGRSAIRNRGGMLV